MKFNSQVCTSVEQSKRLLELGLSPETADCCLDDVIEGIYSPMAVKKIFKSQIPAWSLHRLIELYKDVEEISLWSLEYVNYNRLIQCIGLAIKHGDFNKEYLKQDNPELLKGGEK